MANQPELPQYDAGVYQLESTDPVDGGVGAVSNKPLLNLADRTAYLKVHVDNLENGTTIPPTVAPLNSPLFTGTPTAPTASLGDNTTKIATDAFVQGTVNGVSTISVAGNVNVSLTTVQAGAGILVLTGMLTGNISVIVPSTSAKWEISNQTTGAFTLTVKTAAGAGVIVAQGKNTMLWCDGTNVNDAKTDFPSPALTGTPTAPTAASGDNSTSIANTGFVFNATDGMATANVAGNVDVTLTQAQYGCALLNLTGALTGNINLKFPQQTGQWVIANNSTGGFAITGKTTATGTPAAVVLPQGSAVIVYSDGTNMYLASSGGQTSLTRTQFTPLAGTTSLPVPTGYTAGNILIEKNGVMLEPADFTATNGSTITLTTATIAGDVINVYAFKTFSVANAVLKSGDTLNGPLALFGGDTGVTPTAGDNSTKLATTAFVGTAIQNGNPGLYLGTQTFSASGTYTPGTYTINGRSVTASKARIRMIGGGGAGGGTAATSSSTASVGTGGSAGAVAEFIIASGLSATAVSIGAGGTGVSGGNGNSGGNTIFGSYCTCAGGVGGTMYGPTATLSIFSVQSNNTNPSVSGATSVPYTSAGMIASSPAFILSNTNLFSGQGANSQFGSGGGGQGNGLGAIGKGYGAGGGGSAAVISMAAQAGGNGSPGLLIVDEYA